MSLPQRFDNEPPPVQIRCVLGNHMSSMIFIFTPFFAQNYGLILNDVPVAQYWNRITVYVPGYLIRVEFNRESVHLEWYRLVETSALTVVLSRSSQ